ncbi:MAG: autotransporter domain-containing protein, partial [bacterium]
DFAVTSDTPAPVGGLTATITLTGANDFVATAERTQTITILANAMTATASFTIADDAADEPNATATATINANAAYSLGSPSTATATINDDEPTLPRLTIAADQSTFTEAPDPPVATADFTVTASPAPADDLPVEVTLTGAPTFITAARTQTITILANAASATASFAITPDTDNEPSADAVATINANAAAYNLGTPSSATARICDDDGGACGISAAAEMAVEKSLPVVAAAIASNVADAISNRIDAVGGGGNNHFDAASLTASFATQGAAAMANGAEFESVVGDGVKRLLDGKTHSLALSGDGGASDGAGVWLGGSYQNLGGEDEALDWDGALYSVQVGADARLNNGVLAGAAVSRSEGEWDYENVGDDDKPVEGTIELSTTSVHPYLAWRRAGGMDIWASIGYGEGDLENREDTNGGAQASGDVELRSASLGIASGDFAVDDASTMRLKFDAQVANTEVDYDDATTDLDVASRRVRVGMEFGNNGTASGTRRAFELGARYDGGDARSGVGIELGGHLTHDNGDGVSASLNARALLAHGGAHDEWGVSGTLRYASGADGQGLSWRVEPGWGVTQSGVDRLWTESAAELVASDESFTPTMRMDSEIAHGFAFGEGMLTPYTGLRLSDGSRDYRFGGRYKLTALPLEMSVEAYRTERATGNETGALFKAGLTW